MKNAQLICLPFAGAGASFFQKWQGLHESLEVHAVQLPGREKRFLEEPHVDVHRAADEVVSILKEDSLRGAPTVIFGHSLGAVLAFEVTKRVEVMRLYPKLALVASGSPDPWTPRANRASDLADDEAFIAKVSELSGYTDEALEDPMMREVLLPALRADVRMHEDYVPGSDVTVGIPVMTVRGSDDSLVAREQVECWSRSTTSSVRNEELSGGHMYFVQQPQQLLELIAGFLPGTK
jgi:surfactin synthase thioesterase subunit